MRVFITGDTHGQFHRIFRFVQDYHTTKEDILIILGDAGINYYLNRREYKEKKYLQSLPITLFMIHGNHEERPFNIDSYKLTTVFNALAYIEPEFPNLIFAKDGENYTIGNHQYFVLGGAYSVDKHYRIRNGFHWFKNEQPDEQIKNFVSNQIRQLNYQVDIVLSHTCPFKYQPTELFLSSVDQSLVDKSTEEWLQNIEEKISYNHWYFGHFHSNKSINKKVDMLFEGIIEVK